LDHTKDLKNGVCGFLSHVVNVLVGSRESPICNAAINLPPK